jgi:hypothetical protein
VKLAGLYDDDLARSERGLDLADARGGDVRGDPVLAAGVADLAAVRPHFPHGEAVAELD